MKKFAKQFLLSASLILLSSPLAADVNRDIYSMDLAQLMNVEIVSASKKSEPLADSSSKCNFCKRI